MDRRNFLAAGAVAAAVTAGSLAAYAGDHDDRDDDDIVGSWFGTVTATNPPLGTFNEMASFHEDGIVTESRRYKVPGTPFGTLLETTGHGAWKKTGRRAFEAFFRFFLQSDDTGAPIGTDNIRLSFRLTREGTLDGTFQSQIKDNTDTVIFAVTGTYTATRITV